MGRPNAGVKLTLLEITLSGPAAFLPIWQQLQLNVFRRESGLLVWRTEQGQSVRRLTFFNAPCVALAFQLDAKGQGQEAASGLRLRFSPAAVQLDGVFVELYSRLHWEKDAAIRRRALVNPFPLPGLCPPPIAPPRPLPPELPTLPPLAPVVGGALALAGLLLTPANSADEPGNDAEWQFIEQQKQGFKDRSRLTYLERERECRALSVAEEAEYIALLAKVKGIVGGKETEVAVPATTTPLGGAARAAEYSSGWPGASLRETIAKFAPGVQPVQTTTGKNLYLNNKTGIQIVHDKAGDYFRIHDTNVSGKRAYLAMDGKIPNNKLVDGRTIGRSQAEYNEITHFKNTD